MKKRNVLIGVLAVMIVALVLGVGYKLNKADKVVVEFAPFTMINLKEHHQKIGFEYSDLDSITIDSKELTKEQFLTLQKEQAKEYNVDHKEGQFIAIEDAIFSYKKGFKKYDIEFKNSKKLSYDLRFYYDNQIMEENHLTIETLDELENLKVVPCQMQFGECRDVDALELEDNNQEVKEGKQTFTYKIKGIATNVEKDLEIEYTPKVVEESKPNEEVADNNKPTTKPSYQKKQALYLGKPYVYINREYGFDAGYVPANIVYFPDGYSVDTGYRGVKEMVDHFVNMNDTLKQETGLWMLNTSSYRNYEFQNRLYTGYVNDLGQKEADRISARPGHSEHQTGLVVDVTTPGGSMWTFGQTKQYQWVKENGHRFGFIIRYPEGKEHITKYAPEAWHLRYVGKEYAEKVYRSNLTFDEIINP